MKTTPTPVPHFGIGESEAPLQYLQTALPSFCRRIGMTESRLEHFVETGFASAKACIPYLSLKSMMKGMLEPIPQARTFWNLVGDTLLDESSTFTGLEHLRTAMTYQKQGWNVVLVQNHRSGADMMVMETLIRRNLEQDICAEWAYVARHAVNLYLIPLMFSAAIRRFQIFSVKYQSNGIAGMDKVKMKEQNTRAILALSEKTSKGGTVTAYYPEGGRSDGYLKTGEPRSSCIPRNIAQSGCKLLVLPTYVSRTEQILRPVRGVNEFNEVLMHMERGSATCIIGQPICWDAIQENNRAFEDKRYEWNRRVCDTLLALIGRLAPAQEAGYYSQGNAGIWSLIAPLLNEV